MTPIVLEHVDFEGPAAIGMWFAERDIPLKRIRLYVGDALPAPQDTDMLIIMGGPMSIHDAADYPWMTAEKFYIRECLERRIPVLGICLGAQLIAESLGGKVIPNDEREIGWYPVSATPECPEAIFPPTFHAFHWHGERFTLPPGAIRLASSQACPEQGFLFSDHVMGLQFHLETTRESAQLLMENSADDLAPGSWVQTSAEISSTVEHTYKLANALMSSVLEYLSSVEGRTDTNDRTPSMGGR